ncbi:sugar transferase [Nocardioides nanhaiensis]|uniref:Exopolysaccharide biosynthesis polyprenyl glycosylphosphotransferase n=1 Tax=Nocardioides nanhaiensis TaxID=1476871 RepID=A0ABP8VRQ0_9ACTN
MSISTSGGADARRARLITRKGRSLGATPAELEQMVRGGGRRRRWSRRVQPYLVLGDLAVVLLVTAIASATPAAGALAGLAALLVLAARGAYRSRLTLSALDDAPTMAMAALVALAAESAVLMAAGGQPSGQASVLYFAGLALGLGLVRAIAYGVVREARRRGWVQHRTLILGADQTGRQLARAALDHPEYGLLPVGFLDHDGAAVDDDEPLPVPLLGSYQQLATFVRREGVSEVIVAFLDSEGARNAVSVHDDGRLVEAIRACDRLDAEIFVVPRLHELRHRGSDVDELWGIPLVRSRRATWRSPSWRLKRVLDVLVSGAALVAISPLLLALAVAVRLEVGPSVLFRQTRVGLDGEPFTLLKFRSLTLPDSPDDGGGAAAVWSINADARLGPVGRFIRATSLDELPQLINILRGDMSLVGPRPERPEFVDEFARSIPRYTARHRAPAGLTGWAQVNGLRGDTSIEERARFDNYYIQNWSLWLDAKIMARTVSSVLLRRGS